MPTYTVHKLPAGREPRDWNDPLWSMAEAAGIASFHPRSSDHRPAVEAKALYSDGRVFVRFEVRDRYVRCTRVGYQQMVCMDSCVEFFVRPRADRGYLNFEMNCGGALLLYYIEDARRVPGGFAKFTPVDQSLVGDVRILHSLPQVVEPEIAEPTEWFLQLSFPLSLAEHFVGPLKPHGARWQGNFYKCGDKTSHPHWGSWASIGDELNFHQPGKFGELVLAAE